MKKPTLYILHSLYITTLQILFMFHIFSINNFFFFFWFQDPVHITFPLVSYCISFFSSCQWQFLISLFFMILKVLRNIGQSEFRLFFAWFDGIMGFEKNTIKGYPCFHIPAESMWHPHNTGDDLNNMVFVRFLYCKLTIYHFLLLCSLESS